MSTTLFQGASGPSGHTGLRAALGQRAVSGDHPAPQQISPEQSIPREIKRLIVSLLDDVFNPGAEKLSGCSSALLKR